MPDNVLPEDFINAIKYSDYSSVSFLYYFPLMLTQTIIFTLVPLFDNIKYLLSCNVRTYAIC